MSLALTSRWSSSRGVHAFVDMAPYKGVASTFVPSPPPFSLPSLFLSLVSCSVHSLSTIAILPHRPPCLLFVCLTAIASAS